MAKYVGDLTDPDNGVERQKVAGMVDEIAEAVRDRRVRHLTVAYDRKVLDDFSVFGVEPAMSAWTVGIEVTRRGRHEEATDDVISV